MPDIIELIDNAIDDAMSPDAMRWTPVASTCPKPARGSCWVGSSGQMFYDYSTVAEVPADRYSAGEWAGAHGVELTDWQAVTLRRYLDPSIMFPTLDRDEAVERLRGALGYSPTGVIIDEINRGESALGAS